MYLGTSRGCFHRVIGTSDYELSVSLRQPGLLHRLRDHAYTRLGKHSAVTTSRLVSPFHSKPVIIPYIIIAMLGPSLNVNKVKVSNFGSRGRGQGRLPIDTK